VTGRPAAFLDRDGTIIRDATYIRDPNDVELVPGAAAAIRSLNDASVPVIVVTNQSGIARELLTFDDYNAVRERNEAYLANRFPGRIFGLLLRVPVINGEAITPDLEISENRLYEWSPEEEDDE